MPGTITAPLPITNDRNRKATFMTHPMSRRTTLGLAAAAAVLPFRPVHAAAARVLQASTRILDVEGKPASVFSLRGPDGKPGLTLDPGERFAIDLANGAGAKTIVHWHGQLPPWIQDGFPWPQTPAIEPGASRRYDYAPIPGTFWMHSHQGLQEQSLMTAPLIVRSAADLRADRQEVVMMLHDFSFRHPDELLAGLTHASPAASHVASRQVENVQPTPMPATDEPSMAGMAMPSMKMDLNDIAYDAFLANDRTLADPEIVPVARGGRVRLRIINGASSSQFWISLGGLTGQVVAVDGHDVHPVAGTRFPIAIAQRLDILIDLPGSGAYPILAMLEGSVHRTGLILATPGALVPRVPAKADRRAPPIDLSLERRLTALHPPAARRADRTHRIVLAGGMQPYAWSLNGEFWPHITPLMLQPGHRIEIDLVNDSMMAHPMHLHGHAFQVVAIDGRRIQGALRDTVLVPGRQGSHIRIAFDADNPGRWAFHCHNLYHMAAGMMTEFRYHGVAV